MDFPSSYGTMNNTEIYNLLSKELGTSNVLISDMQLNLTTTNDALRFVQETQVAKHKYIAEGHDCDNFSFELMGYWSDGLKSFAFGIAWSQDHAFNIMIDSTKKVWIVEPQTNQFIDIPTAKSAGHYFPIEIVMI